MGQISLYLVIASCVLLPSAVFASELEFSLEENIVVPITLQIGANMHFAKIIEGAFEGELSTDDSANGDYGHAASVSVTGEPNETIRVTGPESGLVLNGEKGNIDVVLTAVADCGELIGGVVNLGKKGNCTLTISGRATVPHGQGSGYYSGQQVIIVGYY